MAISSLPFKKFLAEQRRLERDEARRQKELEKLFKEREKLNAREAAELEVAAFQARLDVLLSLHKHVPTKWVWEEWACKLTPPEPTRRTKDELQVHFRRIFGLSPVGKEFQAARESDGEAYQKALKEYETERNEHQKLKTLVNRILSGTGDGYSEALTELSSFAEISELGSSISFKIHGGNIIEGSLDIIGSHVIPAEVKTLTASGKVSIKPMPRARFHEIYQDYVCGCMLRAAREVFSLLPINKVLLHAKSEVTSSVTGLNQQLPVLSVIFDRDRFNTLNFGNLDPSDCVQSFPHRGTFKKAAKNETFTPITPMTIEDAMCQASASDRGSNHLISEVIKLRNTIDRMIAEL